MTRGDKSGITVHPADVPIIMGMIARGDRHHDIAAWFGLNQGRIADTQEGKYGPPETKAGIPLPPKGPPGIKGRELRAAATSVLGKLKAGDIAGAVARLEKAIAHYDANEA
jgi:hypothetical protein